MIPVLDKESIKAITKALTPEEAQYVTSVSNLLKKINNGKDEIDIILENDIDRDILFVTKIMAFCDKFRALHWAAVNISYHEKIDEFLGELEHFKDQIAEDIQGISKQFKASDFEKIELPFGDDPLKIIDELKITVLDWYELHKDDMNYEGCRNSLAALLENISKYVYLFRLAK